MRTPLLAAVLLVIAGGTMPAQQFPPGYVDPAPLLAAAAKAMGSTAKDCPSPGTGGAVVWGPCK
jgi:hypothetical protein